MKRLDERKLKEWYWRKVPLTEIASRFGCCVITVTHRLRRLKWKRVRLSNIENIAGKRYGQLVALKYIRNDRFGKAIWKVRCSCGREKEINASGMKAGLVRSCGCYKQKQLRTGYKDLSGSYWRKLQKSAITRGLCFTVTKKAAWSKFVAQNKKCALSGVPLTLLPNGDKYYAQTASLDRINSSLGYTNKNTQWVHKRVNFLKRDYPESELVYWCYNIVKTIGKRFAALDPCALKETRALNENIKTIKIKRAVHTV